MNLRKALGELARIIADEADRNPELRNRVLRALEREGEADAVRTKNSNGRPKSRRAPAVLDPVQVVASGEETLRAKLGGLNVEQLQDIVSDFGMDPGRIIWRWKTRERIVDRIVEISISRAKKGDAFRAD